MNLKPLANLVTSKAGRSILKVQKYSPQLLFAAGVVGVVGATVLACRATLKLEEVLEETEDKLEKRELALESDDYSVNDYQRDGVIIYTQATIKVAKLYAPAVVIGAASIAALTGSHIILNRRNVALTAAYAALDKGFRSYRQRVVNDLGKDKDKEFLYGFEERTVVDETPEGTVTSVVKDVVPKEGMSMYAAVFAKETSASWSPENYRNQMFIQCQQQYANDLLRSRGHVFLNEVYDMLGLARTRAGAVVGWVLDGGNSDNFIDFGVFEGNRDSGMRFIKGYSRDIWLDFNVDGIIWDKI